ncbi:uncharacterized protein N7459_004313 [Penicillium hispanicum]|uniref:uncharacterized protein n=1 Tax=Penicillium hispanicum TaxID=1080232 RepID=UPI00254047A8|nr:uncharacterized protein N7459_004313 [Penicillium hispanicum]KAJ5584513.1 hypothetical protein N7459_004313 [Penicillium hispanicum]
MPLYKRKITVDDGAVTSAVHLTLQQSLFPNALVMILFFLWGFGYGLLDTLNSHFQTTLDITAGRSSGLQASYFAAYFICPLTISGWIVRKYGFRVTFMTGLAVLAVGCLLFWPSGMKRSFGGFCGSMFVVGAGLSTLETAADPFLSICGPPKYSEIRLNIGQAVQGVGTFIAPLLASRVFFANTVDTNAGLKNVQWTYLGVACFVALLIILFYLAPFPEITDADQEVLESQIADNYQDTGPFRKQYTLFLGVWSQFCYVGAQAAVAGYFINFCEEAGRSSSTSFAAMTTHGTASVAMIILVLCFESLCFATIFTLALRGLGRHTKRGGSMLVAAISGGMVFPPMMGAVVTKVNAHAAMAIPMMGYILALIFPVYVNIYKKDVMDLHRDTEVNATLPVSKDVALEEGTHEAIQGKSTTLNVETVKEQR